MWNRKVIYPSFIFCNLWVVKKLTEYYRTLEVGILSSEERVEWIHLNQHYFSPNWEKMPAKKWAFVVQELAAKEAWIIDGNSSGTLDVRLQRADTLIYLDRS